MLELPLAGLNDPEGDRVPQSLPPIVDAHVHLFPDGFFQAIWNWFHRFAWPVRYQLTSHQIMQFLLSRGVTRIVGLHYPHAAGIAPYLNTHMAELCEAYPQLTGLATVLPGERNASRILSEGFAAGLAGVKLHAHVQFFSMDSPAMEEIYQVCCAFDKPLVMHVGREPRNPNYDYPVDPYRICRADKLEEVVRSYPRLRVCVPHLGANEYADYQRMVEQYDNLWLDTAMVLTDYLPGNDPPHLASMRTDRIMFGTDFPNIPYAWDRELRHLIALHLPEEALERILGLNALEFFRIVT